MSLPSKPSISKRCTPKQRQIFDFLRRYTLERGYAPSLEEIRDHLGLAAVSTVHEHLANMEAKGLLKRKENVARGTELAVSPPVPACELPLLGSVIAGPPTESFVVEEVISVPGDLVKGGEHFALRVMGESMRDDDIVEGDVLIVRQTQRAGPGDLVIALIEGREATVKRFYPEKDHVRLQPSNREMEPILVPKRDLQIQGIVVGLLRQYDRV